MSHEAVERRPLGGMDLISYEVNATTPRECGNAPALLLLAIAQDAQSGMDVRSIVFECNEDDLQAGEDGRTGFATYYAVVVCNGANL